MPDTSLWFNTTVEEGNTVPILHLFKMIAGSYKSHEFVTNTIKITLAIIRNIEVLRDSNADFQILGRDGAFLAAAIYRLHKLCIPGGLLEEQAKIMFQLLKSVEAFTTASVKRNFIHRAIMKHTDRKTIETYRRRIMDILADVEFKLLLQFKPAVQDEILIQDVLTSTDRDISFEPHQGHDLPVESDIDAQSSERVLDERPSRETEKEQINVLDDSTTNVLRTRIPGKRSGTGVASNISYPGCHDLSSQSYPAYAISPQLGPFRPCHAVVGASNVFAPPLTPSTIIYDYSSHTTHHGSHNYQGQTVNQSHEFQGPSTWGHQDIYMKHFNGNEIHCWTPSVNDYPQFPPAASRINNRPSESYDHESNPNIRNLNVGNHEHPFTNDRVNSSIFCSSSSEPSSRPVPYSPHSTM